MERGGGRLFVEAKEEKVRDSVRRRLVDKRNVVVDERAKKQLGKYDVSKKMAENVFCRENKLTGKKRATQNEEGEKCECEREKERREHENRENSRAKVTRGGDQRDQGDQRNQSGD